MVAKALKASDLEKSSQLERISCAVVEFSEMKKGGHSWVGGGAWHGNRGMNLGCPPWKLTVRPSNYLMMLLFQLLYVQNLEVEA